VDPQRIGIIGNSMGGATAILAAADYPSLRAVVAEGTFADVRDIETGIRIVNILP
jgi:dienelactone hydrolase